MRFCVRARSTDASGLAARFIAPRPHAAVGDRDTTWRAGRIVSTAPALGGRDARWGIPAGATPPAAAARAIPFAIAEASRIRGVLPPVLACAGTRAAPAPPLPTAGRPTGTVGDTVGGVVARWAKVAESPSGSAAAEIGRAHV